MNTLKMFTTCMRNHGGKKLWGFGVRVRVPVVAAIGFALLTSGRVHAAVFQCLAGNAECLIAAINTANGNGENNTITLGAGTYTLMTVDNTTDEGANGLPSITSPLTLTGAGAETTIVERALDAPPFRIFHVAAAGTLTLERVMLRGGRADLGGGIFNNGGRVSISTGTITNSFADFDGGGIYNALGVVTVINSTIARNGVGPGGGGGIENAGGEVTIDHSTIADNGAELGGGIFNFLFGTVTVTNSTIAGNIADRGGGIINSSTVTIINSTIADNIAVFGSGGGIATSFGTVTITNSTIAGNLADGGSGGGIESFMGAIALHNTILASNTAELTGEPNPGPDCFGPIVSMGHNLIGDPTDCTITLQASDLTGDPGLADFTEDGTPGHGYFPLLASSPAIDAGNNAVCPPTDQLEQPRVGTCDIGAIEFQSEALTVAIDIKPGSDTNRINPNSHGKIPVAILTTETFDATTVDPRSVRFGPDGAKAVQKKGQIKDVNDDGEPDLVLRFRIQATGIQCGETSASLTGKTVAGEPIKGSDAIQTVGCDQYRSWVGRDF
jgi:hypothetical protein